MSACVTTKSHLCGWLGIATFVVGAPAVFAQGGPPLVDLAPITEGIVPNARISSEEMRGRFETLVEAINALHARVDVLERQTLTQGTYNLAFHYDPGTGRFSIRCLDEQSQAVACSAENPGYVVMPSVRHGGLVRLIVDTDLHFFHDARAAAANQDLAGNSFNSAQGRPWPERRPFFIYAVNRDDTKEGLRFALTLHPAAMRVPQFGVARHVIGARRAPADANEAVDFVFLWGNGENDRTALERDYKTIPKPVLRIGSLEMSKLVVGGVDQWRIERWGPDRDEEGNLLGEWRAGLGRYPWNVQYALPPGSVSGTSAAGYLNERNANDRCPTQSYLYAVQADGLVVSTVHLAGCRARDPANGPPAEALQLAIPFVGESVIAAAGGAATYLSTWPADTATAASDLISGYLDGDGDALRFLRYVPADESLEPLTAVRFLTGEGSGSLDFMFSYRAFVD